MDIFVKRPILYTILTLGIGAVYTMTMAPTIYAFDSAELAAAAYTLGVVHAPGYAVYLLIAHLFTYIPVGEIGYRVNWLSAVSTIASSLVMADLLWHLTKRHIISIIVATLTFCFSFYVWTLSVIAEVYTFQVFFLSLMIWFVFHWSQEGRIWHLKAAVFVAGLAVINNPSTVLWWPGLFVFAWFTPARKTLTRQDYLTLIGYGSLGLLPVLYYPWRTIAAPPFWYAGAFDHTTAFHPLDLRYPANIIWYLSGRQFDSYIFGYQVTELPAQVSEFIYRLWAAFYGVGLPLGLYGIWKMWQSKRIITASLVIIALSHAIFFITYRASDKDTMFLPVYFIWAIFIGYAIFASADLSSLFPTLSLLLPVTLLFVNINYVDVYDYYEVQHTAEARLSQAPPNTIYIASWGEASAMEYQQIVHQQRLDVLVINPFLTSASTRSGIAAQAIEEGRPLYYSYRDIDLVHNYRFKSIPLGYTVEPRN